MRNAGNSWGQDLEIFKDRHQGGTLKLHPREFPSYWSGFLQASSYEYENRNINGVRRHSAYERTMVGIFSILGLVLALALLRGLLDVRYTIGAVAFYPACDQTLWNLVTDIEDRPLWESGVINIAPLTVRQGVVGARSLVIKRWGSDRIEIEEEITEFKTGSGWSARLTALEFVGTRHLKMVTAEKGCRLEISEVIIPKGYRDKVMTPLHSWQGTGALEHSLARLQTLVTEAMLSRQNRARTSED